jgi:hypothetical protein
VITWGVTQGLMSALTYVDALFTRH